MFCSISSYYEKLLATGEVKCIDEEVPFEIPKGWEWCRLASVSFSIADGDHMPPPKSFDGIPFIVISNIAKGVLDLNTTRYVPVEYYEKLSKERVPQKDDILFSVTGSYGIAVRILTANVFCFQRHIALIKPLLASAEYIELLLNSPLIRTQCDKTATGMAQKTVGIDSLRRFLVPIPPFQEQIKIVEKCNLLEPFIRKCSEVQEKLNRINEDINEELKKSILQEAIQGKLVPQIANEGTAQELLEQIKAEKQELVKEGKLKKSALVSSVIFRGDDNKYYEQIGSEVTEIELPFDFPSSWSIARLNTVCQLTDGLKTTGKQCLLDAKYLRGKSSETIVEQGKLVYKGDNIVLVDGENSGEVFIVPQDGYMGSTFKQLWISSSMYQPYVLAFIQFYKETLRNSKRGAAIPHLNKELFYGLIIGIPPLQEQKRIVRKIEQSSQLLR